MAPALEPPMTQSPSTSSKRARHIVPIIPAIPRSLEKKPKPQTETLKSEQIIAAPIASESSHVTHEENLALPAPEAQVEDHAESLDTGDIVDESLKLPTDDGALCKSDL